MKIKNLNAAPALVAIIYILLLFSGFFVTDNSDVDPYLSVIIIELLIFALPALFFCRLRGKNYGKRIRMKFFEPGCIPFILTASVTLMLASCAVKLGIYAIFDYSLDVTDIYRSYVPESSGGVSVIFTALAFAVFPAITEELVFRGIVLAEYETCGVFSASLLSSFLFAMLHFDLKLLPVYFISGMILSLTAYTSRSVLAPMLVHTINNIFSVFFEDYIWNSILQPRNIVIFSFVIITLLTVMLMLLFGEAGRIYKSYGQYGEDSSYRLKKSERTPLVYAVMTIPFSVCILIYVFAVLL